MAEDQGDRRPVPDPTALTTDQLHREIEQLRELLETRIDCLDRITTQRFALSDEALKTTLAASKEAITKSEEHNEKRSNAAYVTVNELQRNLADIMPRAETENRLSTIAEAVSDLRIRVAAAESMKLGSRELITEQRAEKSGMHMSAGMVIGIIGAVVSVIVLMLAVVSATNASG